MTTGYRSLQQIAAKNLHQEFESVIASLNIFATMTSPQAHKDSTDKLRKVQRRIADRMHKDDKP